jgi:hypothetical protein
MFALDTSCGADEPRSQRSDDHPVIAAVDPNTGTDLNVGQRPEPQRGTTRALAENDLDDHLASSRKPTFFAFGGANPSIVEGRRPRGGFWPRSGWQLISGRLQ